MAKHMQVIAMANRFRVFRLVKRIMETEGRCPPAAEVAELLDISRTTAQEHLRALNGADGLPLCTDGLTRQRLGDTPYEWDRSLQAAHGWQFQAGMNVDPNLVPLDLLIA